MREGGPKRWYQNASKKLKVGCYIPFFWWYMVGFDEICIKILCGLHCVRIDVSPATMLGFISVIRADSVGFHHVTT